MLDEPTPHEADPTGSQYAFEKRVVKAGGGEGFADVWKRDFFAWEYKGHRKDLKAAYVQLMGYKDDLGNPPLLVVSDLERVEVRTNFTGLSPVLKVVTLDDLAAGDSSDALGLLRCGSPKASGRATVRPTPARKGDQGCDSSNENAAPRRSASSSPSGRGGQGHELGSRRLSREAGRPAWSTRSPRTCGTSIDGWRGSSRPERRPSTH
jgi:hypothetical protein